MTLFMAIIISHMWESAFRNAQAIERAGEMTISIDAEGIHARSSISASTTPWHMIAALRRDRHNLYFIVDTPKASLMLAFVIPRRVFSNQLETESFMEQARDYWNEQNEQHVTIS